MDTTVTRYLGRPGYADLDGEHIVKRQQDAGVHEVLPLAHVREEDLVGAGAVRVHDRRQTQQPADIISL